MEAAAEKSRSATVLDLQAWTCYNLYWTTSWGNLLSDMHVPHEQWVLDRHFWCFFCLLFTGIRHLPHMLTVSPTKACRLCTTPAGMDLYIYRSMPACAYWVQSPGFPKIVYSQFCLLHHLFLLNVFCLFSSVQFCELLDKNEMRVKCEVQVESFFIPQI